uniref:Uncharacterized protein n=1 Tax=Anopheles albimanus TaxID=7167 RepID=A0A182FVK1_ANOAL
MAMLAHDDDDHYSYSWGRSSVVHQIARCKRYRMHRRLFHPSGQVYVAEQRNRCPPPQLELITCLANSSTLNVTTKHCDCETYSCKDVLASSSPSPLNQIPTKSSTQILFGSEGAISAPVQLIV